MKVIHTFFYCLECQKVLEIEDGDLEGGAVVCPECGYTNILSDPKVVDSTWEQEY